MNFVSILFTWFFTIIGEAIEQAYGALYLASDESTFTTGMDFLVDGGITAGYVTAEGPTTSLPVYKNASGL